MSNVVEGKECEDRKMDLFRTIDLPSTYCNHPLSSTQPDAISAPAI